METMKAAPPMRRPIRQRGSAHESQTWWREFFGEVEYCEVRYGIPLSGMIVPESHGQGAIVSKQNKEKMRRVFEEALGQGKVEVIDEILHPDFVIHDPNSEAGQIRGAETMKGEIGHFRAAFPDLTYTVEDQVTEGDKVVSRYTVSGTHRGEFFGLAGTGRRMEIMGISIDRFDEGGRLIEEWPAYDLLGAIKQLGAFPGPA